MAQGKKISELNEVSSVTDNDEFLFVDKEGSGANSGVGGKTAKIKFSDLKSAIGAGSTGAKGASGDKGMKGEPGPRGLDGAGTQYWTQSPSDGDAVYYDAGNVGVGTTDPTASLHLKRTGSNSSAMIRMENADASDSNAKLWYFSHDDTAGTGNAGFNIGHWDGAEVGGYHNDIHISQTGNFGIGTNSPSATLDVSSSDAEKNSAIFSNTHADGYGAKFIGGGGGDNDYHYLASFRDYEGNEKLRLQGDGELQIAEYGKLAFHGKYTDTSGNEIHREFVMSIGDEGETDTLILRAHTPENGVSIAGGGQLVFRSDYDRSTELTGNDLRSGIHFISGTPGSDNVHPLMRITNGGHVSLGQATNRSAEATLNVRNVMNTPTSGFSSFTYNSKVVTGVDTKYTTEFSVGDIFSGNNLYFGVNQVVESIESDTQMTMEREWIGDSADANNQNGLANQVLRKNPNTIVFSASTSDNHARLVVEQTTHPKSYWPCNGRVKIGPEYIEDYNEAPHERNYITFVQDGWVHGDQDWPVDGAEATPSDGPARNFPLDRDGRRTANFGTGIMFNPPVSSSDGPYSTQLIAVSKGIKNNPAESLYVRSRHSNPNTSDMDRANENAFTSWGAVYHSAGVAHSGMQSASLHVEGSVQMLERTHIIENVTNFQNTSLVSYLPNPIGCGGGYIELHYANATGDNLENGWRFYKLIDGNNSKSEVEPLNPTGGVIRHWIPKEDLGKQFGLKPNGATTPQTLDIRVTRVKFIPSFNLSDGNVGIGTESGGEPLRVMQERNDRMVTARFADNGQVDSENPVCVTPIRLQAKNASDNRNTYMDLAVDPEHGRVGLGSGHSSGHLPSGEQDLRRCGVEMELGGSTRINDTYISQPLTFYNTNGNADYFTRKIRFQCPPGEYYGTLKFFGVSQFSNTGNTFVKEYEIVGFADSANTTHYGEVKDTPSKSLGNASTVNTGAIAFGYDNGVAFVDVTLTFTSNYRCHASATSTQMRSMSVGSILGIRPIGVDLENVQLPEEGYSEPKREDYLFPFEKGEVSE